MRMPIQAGEEAKLRLIESISHSQEAMARILGSLADVTEISGDAARRLAGNIDQLTKYQEAMARTVCGLVLHRVNYGTPSSPWITDACYAAYDSTRGETGGFRNGQNETPAHPPGKAAPLKESAAW